MSLYRGVNGVARNILKEYRGVNGVARNILKEYRGVNGVARQYFSSGKKYEFVPTHDELQTDQYYVIEQNDSEKFICTVGRTTSEEGLDGAIRMTLCNKGTATRANIEANTPITVSYTVTYNTDYSSVGHTLFFSHSGSTVRIGNIQVVDSSCVWNTYYGYYGDNIDNQTFTVPAEGGIYFYFGIWNEYYSSAGGWITLTVTYLKIGDDVIIG